MPERARKDKHKHRVLRTPATSKPAWLKALRVFLCPKSVKLVVEKLVVESCIALQMCCFGKLLRGFLFLPFKNLHHYLYH